MSKKLSERDKKLEISIELYAQVYEENAEFRQLTESALLDLE